MKPDEKLSDSDDDDKCFWISTNFTTFIKKIFTQNIGKWVLKWSVLPRKFGGTHEKPFEAQYDPQNGLFY